MTALNINSKLSKALKYSGWTLTFNSSELKSYFNWIVDAFDTKTASRMVFPMIMLAENDADLALHRKSIRGILSKRDEKNDNNPLNVNINSMDSDMDIDNDDTNDNKLEKQNQCLIGMPSEIVREIVSFTDLRDIHQLSLTNRYFYDPLFENFKCSNFDSQTMLNLISYASQRSDYKYLELIRKCNNVEITIPNNNYDVKNWRICLTEILKKGYLKHIDGLSISAAPSKLFIDIISNSSSIQKLFCKFTKMAKIKDPFGNQYKQISINDVTRLIATILSEKLHTFGAKCIGCKSKSDIQLIPDEMIQNAEHIQIAYNKDLLENIITKTLNFNKSETKSKLTNLTIELESNQSSH